MRLKCGSGNRKKIFFNCKGIKKGEEDKWENIVYNSLMYLCFVKVVWKVLHGIGANHSAILVVAFG